VWLDVAREYTERWVHQQQIWEATGHPGLNSGEFAGPVVATFVHSLPRARGPIDRPEGTSLEVRFDGEGGDVWHVTRAGTGWDLRPGPVSGFDATLRGTVDEAWRLYADYAVVQLSGEGDPELISAAAAARAIIL
jgi:hypothetical protein